jgi:hypothetical protein
MLNLDVKQNIKNFTYKNTKNKKQMFHKNWPK